MGNYSAHSSSCGGAIRHLEDRGILIKGRDDCRTVQHQLKGIGSRARYYTLKYDPLQDL